MKKVMNWIKNLITKVLALKLIYRMLIIYLLCGVTPLLISEAYLIISMSDILIKQEQDTAISEITALSKQLSESLNTINSISKYFNFDEKLENISKKQYTSYQENVTDIMSYESFNYFGAFHSDLIQRISILMENDTLKGNSHFLTVNERIQKEPWYQDVIQKRGSVVWCKQTVGLPTEEYLTLTRLLSTKNHEAIGVLVIYLRNRIFLDLVNDKNNNMTILLDGHIPLYISGNDFKLEEWKSYIPTQNEIKNVKINRHGEEYMLTSMNLSLAESSNHIQIMNIISYEDILKEAYIKRKGSIIICSMGIFVAGILILLFSKAYSNRVERFRIQMQKAAQGEFNLDKRIDGNDEISELYDYLSTMIYGIQKLLTDIYREQLQKERLKTKQKDAEFRMLANQINPHFLYNTLETIRMKARAQKEFEIEELVKMLSNILRHNIQIGNAPVSINSEIGILRNYLKIQQYRFGDRIQYTISVAENLLEFKILPLILQPIVENSIIHGLEIKKGTGHILIDIKCHKNLLKIIIEDDGIGMDNMSLNKFQELIEIEEQEENSHIGIINVNQRLKLYYGESYGLELDSKQGIGTKVVLRIPYKEEA